MSSKKSPFNTNTEKTTSKSYSPLATKRSRRFILIGILAFVLVPVEVALTAFVFGKDIKPIYFTILTSSVTLLLAIGSTSIIMSFFPTPTDQ